jgi:cobaltochelatase CobT
VHPFPERTLHAVGACTRALAGAADADVPLLRGSAATLGSLRALGDRLAIRRRFHRTGTHTSSRPVDAASAQIFDALEDARLDAIGAQWLAGVARNLLEHPGAAHDGTRWLAFETFSACSAPRSKVAFVARARGALPPALLESLPALAAHRDDQVRFAEAAARWAIAAAPHLSRAEAAPVKEPGMWPPGRVIERPERRAGMPPPTTTRREQRRGEADAEPTGTGTAPDRPLDNTPGGHAGYRAFTTAHDRVVNAASLADRAELARLRLRLDAELGTIRTTVARVAKRLLRVLMGRQARQWRFDLEEGFLDGSRLATLVASGGRTHPFKQERESLFPETVVTLLIDHSGSMRGRPMLIAALTVEIFARVLERCNVRCEVLGFTTREWNGGEPAREWAAQGYPEHPGRLNALEHIIVKSADVPWRRARIGLGLSLHDEMLKENIDGEALGWAHRRLLDRPEPRRILVVVSDGTPMDEATLAANGYDYLDSHLQVVVQDVETRSPVQLAAIGIGHNVASFYQNATRIERIEDLGPALTNKLVTLLAERDPAAPSGRSVRRRPPVLRRDT